MKGILVVENNGLVEIPGGKKEEKDNHEDNFVTARNIALRETIEECCNNDPIIKKYIEELFPIEHISKLVYADGLGGHITFIKEINNEELNIFKKAKNELINGNVNKSDKTTINTTYENMWLLPFNQIRLILSSAETIDVNVNNFDVAVIDLEMTKIEMKKLRSLNIAIFEKLFEQ